MNLAEDRVSEFIEACYNAGIKSPDSFLLSKRPQVYDWLKGVFPRGILPTDIDGEVEINGHFLRLEFKSESALRNGHVPKGQRKALMGLVKTGAFTVFIIGVNQQGEPTCMESFSSRGIFPVREVSRDEIRDYCRKWALSVDNQTERRNQ